VRLYDAIRISIPSFAKLLIDDDGAVQLATLQVLRELADDGRLQSDTIAKRLIYALRSRLPEGNRNNNSIDHYTTGGLQ
jgi:hypothetical protein